jgi:LAS superfamily LD-carboxypeptidase LdcB
MLPSGCTPARGHVTRPRARHLGVAAVLALTIALFVGFVPAASGSNDPRTERDRVRSQKAATAAQVDALQASDSEVDRALQDLDENVRGQQAAYADAQRAAADAEREADEARQAEVAKQQEIDGLREKVSVLAIETYVNPPTDDFLQSFEADTATEAVQRKALLELRSGRDADVLDELRAAEDELSTMREQAEEASETAAERRDAAESRLTQVQSARAQQTQFAAQVQQRLDAKLSEAAALDATDKQLSSQISQQELAIAARLARSTASNSSGGGGGGGGGGGSTVPIIPVGGKIALSNVRGIVVASSIAGALESMLSAAAADGIVLSGTGYRDSSSQVQLRMQHCGTSQYAIYQMPAEQCSPPTARPGASKHEQGLAIDFTWNGSTIQSRGSAAFQWLAAHAGGFGFVNLPSEPWHWSMGGG